ncbi:MAG TPA: erythromycin esterase family protein [Gemmatimonadaceae bacterium]
MTASIDRTFYDGLRRSAHPLSGNRLDFDPLIELVGDSRLVLLGEASHGTHEFYGARAEITKRLIREKGFSAIAVEADWPDAYRVNRYVQGRGNDTDASQALDGFKRFPQWMWRNADVVDFIGWLRDYNDSIQIPQRIGFYGLDLYSLHASMGAVLSYLNRVDPEAALRARQRYACFDHFGEDPQTYGYATASGMTPSCESEVISQLMELQKSAAKYAALDGRMAADDLFFAEQNARVVLNAERYYRAMFGRRASTWNMRDEHMAGTLDSLIAFLERDRREPKVVVWAHNSHLGDARATDMSKRGELNLGQLVREHWGDGASLIGFTTHSGTVTAASDWDEPAERKTVRPALEKSYEALFHDLDIGDFFLGLRGNDEAALGLRQPRLERAIGVIYRPETERMSHYFQARLPHQFDAVLHYDVTRAVEPLERTGLWERGELPETYPSAL